MERNRRDRVDGMTQKDTQLREIWSKEITENKGKRMTEKDTKGREIWKKEVKIGGRRCRKGVTGAVRLWILVPSKCKSTYISSIIDITWV